MWETWVRSLGWEHTLEKEMDIYYCGQESLRRNGVAILVKRVQNAVLGCDLKNDRMISVRFQGKIIQYHGNPSLCPNQ